MYDVKLLSEDLKAEVHRKNSSESSEEVLTHPVIEIVPEHRPEIPEHERRLSNHRKRQRQRSKIEMPDNVCDDLQQTLSSLRQLARQADAESHEVAATANCAGPSSVSRAPRRHSNFTNSSLCFASTPNRSDIKPTGSLELAYIDMNPNRALTSEGYYFKLGNNGGRTGVRRIRSTALETCCPPPPTLTVHPNSVEIVGADIKTAKNPLPPPSTTLIRNQHLNLCPYYGSEIVYPIAEQSDEHQTSHGPDTDVDSLTHNSDSDYENNQGSRSPLLVRLQHIDNIKKVLTIPKEICVLEDIIMGVAEPESTSVNVYRPRDPERTSATSKDALLDNDNSNSSATPEMQDARMEFATDNEGSDKKSDDSCCGSNTSMEYCVDVTERVASALVRRGSIRFKHRSRERRTKDDNGCLDDNKFLDDDSVDSKCREGKNKTVDECKGSGNGGEFRIARTCKKRKSGGLMKIKDADNCSELVQKKRKSGGLLKVKEVGNCSSLIEFDLDWLFDDENDHLRHCKGKSVSCTNFLLF